MKLPCLIPVRGGSTRLPRKWELPWDGYSLLHHTILRVVETPSVERIIVSSDSEEVLEHARLAGPSVELLLEPNIPNAPGTIVETIARVRRMCKLSASYLMLVQATSPFVNPEDLQRLANEVSASAAYVTHLSVAGSTVLLPDEFYQNGCGDGYRHLREPAPSGMGYVFGPGSAWPTKLRQAITQKAPHADINTAEDYATALKLREDWKIYGMDKHGA